MRRLVHAIGVWFLILGLAGPGVGQRAALGASAEPRPAAAFSAPAGYIVHGIHIDPVPTYATQISNFQTAVGKNIGILMYFRPWDKMGITFERDYYVGPCDDGFLPGQALPGAPLNPPGPAGGGRAIMLTWEPLPILANPGPADYDNILNGSYNSLIDACARQLKGWSNVTFLVRFMHEMNLSETAYFSGRPYNQKPDGTGDTEKFKQVWRYVWQRFANLDNGEGVPNVQWVWSPNYASNPNVAWNNLHNYYPGDAYVDWIGLSGYHWTTANFLSYSMLYDAVIRDIQCRYAKPIMHAEVGTVPYSGSYTPPNKKDWITDAYLRSQTYPLVRAFVWFNDFAYRDPSQADFRIWTNTGYNPPPPLVPAPITTAYKTAVADSSFRSTFTGSQLLNPPMTRCAGDAVSSSGVLSARPAAITVGRTGLTSASFDVAALGLGSNTTISISDCPANTNCRFGSPSGPTSQSFTAPWAKHKLFIQAGPSSPLGLRTLTLSGGGHSVTVQVNIAAVVYPTYLPTLRR